MGERLTYGIPARYCVVLVECLGGLFFDGRRSRYRTCTKDTFAGHSGLYFGDFLVVSIVVGVKYRGGQGQLVGYGWLWLVCYN